MQNAMGISRRAGALCAALASYTSKISIIKETRISAGIMQDLLMLHSSLQPPQYPVPISMSPHHPLVSMSTNILWQLENTGLPKPRLNTKHRSIRPLQKAQTNPATYRTSDERKEKYLVLAFRRWIHTEQNQCIESIILPKKKERIISTSSEFKIEHI